MDFFQSNNAPEKLPIIFSSNALVSSVLFRGALITALANQGHHVHLLGSSTRFIPEGMNTDIMNIFDHENVIIHDIDILSPKSLHNTLREVRRVLQQNKDGLLISCEIHTSIVVNAVARAVGMNNRITLLCGLGKYVLLPSLMQSTYNCFLKHTILGGMNNTVITLGSDQQTVIQGVLGKRHDEVWSTILHGELTHIGESAITDEEILEKHNAPPRSFGYVGRLIGLKNVKELLAAFELLAQKDPSLTFHIVGNGEEHLVDQATRLSKTYNAITYHGFMDPGNMSEFLRTSCDCLVMPSRSEGFPTVGKEALMSGCLIVHSNGMGMQGFETTNDGVVLGESCGSGSPSEIVIACSTVATYSVEESVQRAKSGRDTYRENNSNSVILNERKKILSRHGVEM